MGLYTGVALDAVTINNGRVGLVGFTVAQLANYPASAHTREIIYVSNGNAGAATVAVSNGTIWINLVSGTAVSAT
jgi:hypothetical protein